MKRKKLVKVALAGRRNVGKSTLFNALLGKRRAITDSIPGLTRDILEAEIHRGPYHFLLSDTPGLDIENPGDLEKSILERARAHIEEQDLVLLLLEAPAMERFDFQFLDLLRKAAGKRPVIIAVNKVDGKEHAEESLEEFYREGIVGAIPISARGRWNLNTLLEAMAEAVPALRRSEEEGAAPTPDEEEEIRAEGSEEEGEESHSRRREDGF